MKKGDELSDLWWRETDDDGLRIGLGNHPPRDDQYQPIPVSNPNWPEIDDWQHSIDDDGRPAGTFDLHPLSALDDWRSACDNTNVYRTLMIWSESGTSIGPFLIDIDNENFETCESDLTEAFKTARYLIEHILTRGWGLMPVRDFRVFFSGRKAVNIEVIPKALNIHGNVNEQLKASHSLLTEIRKALPETSSVVDAVYGMSEPELRHPYIRLSDSWNAWVHRGVSLRRQRFELTVDKVMTTPVDEITRVAETP